MLPRRQEAACATTEKELLQAAGSLETTKDTVMNTTSTTTSPLPHERHTLATPGMPEASSSGVVNAQPTYNNNTIMSGAKLNASRSLSKSPDMPDVKIDYEL